jgi:hypothetical protein
MWRSRAAVLRITLAIGVTSLASCSYERTPEQTVTTATLYDSASKQLSIACETSTTGTCHLLVKNRQGQLAFSLEEGAKTTIRGVDPTTRTCAAASAIDSDACNWIPVHRADEG